MQLTVKGMNLHIQQGDDGDYLVITSDGPIEITAPSLQFSGHTILQGPVDITGEVNISGNLTVDGNVDATGTIMDIAGNSNHHSH